MNKPVEFFQVIDSTVLVLNILVESSQSEEIAAHGMKHDFYTPQQRCPQNCFLRMSCDISDTVRCHLLHLDGDKMNASTSVCESK